jgi:hypothetical protein
MMLHSPKADYLRHSARDCRQNSMFTPGLNDRKTDQAASFENHHLAARLAELLP